MLIKCGVLVPAGVASGQGLQVELQAKGRHSVDHELSLGPLSTKGLHVAAKAFRG